MSQAKQLLVGDLIKWQGDACVVSVTSEHAARVILPNGLTDLVPNPIKSYFAEKTSSDFSGGNEQEYLNTLLVTFADRREELTKQISVEEDQKMSNKSGKSEAYKTKPRGGLAAQKAATEASGEAPKPKRVRKPAAAKPEGEVKPDAVPKPAKPEGEKKSFIGRADYTRKLALQEPKLTVDEIHVKSRDKFPGASRKTTIQIVEKARAEKKA